MSTSTTMSSPTASASSRSDRDRRPQVVRDGGHEVPARAIGLVARRLLGLAARRSSRWPPPPARASSSCAEVSIRDVALAAADGAQSVADRLDVAQDAAATSSAPIADQHRPPNHDHRHQHGLVPGDDHQHADDHQCRPGPARPRSPPPARTVARGNRPGSEPAVAPLTARTGSRRPRRSRCDAAGRGRARSWPAGGGCGP